MQKYLERYKSLGFYAKQIVEGYITGLHKSPFHGFSIEFAEHRQYNAGEPTRNIDWKLYMRTDRLYTKQYEDETNLRCQIVIDHSSSMDYPQEGRGNRETPNKLTFSVYAAAVLTELLVRQRDAFGLTLLGDSIDLMTETRSSGSHHQYILQILQQEIDRPIDRKSASRASNIAENLHILAEKIHKRTLVVIFTDALVKDYDWNPLMDSLRHLRHCKHEVILFHTLQKETEVDFQFANSPHEFIDMESRQLIKLQPSQIAESYRQSIQKKIEDIRHHATMLRIECVPAYTDQGFDNIIQPFLLKRSKHH